MARNFPIFHSHIDLAHQYWEKLLQKGDWVIDATCGNGNDTLKLAEILAEKQGGIIGIDLQQEAIDKTNHLLQMRLLPALSSRIHLFCQSHADFPELAKRNPIRLIVYNLGYLPTGNKKITTLTESTLQSVRNALHLIIAGGGISITCYPGHAEGGKEQDALLEELSHLPSETWNICYHKFLNRRLSPALLIIQKTIQTDL